MVQFNSGAETIVGYTRFKTEEGMNWPIPLVAAWALNIRRAPGATFKNVILDYQSIGDYPSCKNMMYAALCCAESVEGLQVVGFTRDKCFNLQDEVAQ